MEVRGREIRRQSLKRELELRVEQRRAHAFTRLPNRGAWQAHERELRQAATDVDLHRDLMAVDALDGECGDVCEHAAKVGDRALHVGYECKQFVTSSCQECTGQGVH